MRTKLLFFLFLINGFACCLAQTLISGTVTDSLGIAIPQANIFVQDEKDMIIKAFAYTDNAGRYTLTIKTYGTYWLNVSSLSYKTAQVHLIIDNLVSETAFTKDVMLKAEPFELNEVVVNADIPVLVKKDTITINTANFVNGTEEVVEDILKKLPGIQVDKDGTIKVQGKSVEKVMVEGDDLFEKGYKLLTKNLNAGVIDKVQILAHFSSNALLKNIEDSDKVALNITLKEDQKTNLFGNASAGYGTHQFYENRLNLISFNKKSKYYLFGNLNNTGSDAIGDIYQLIYPDFFSSINYVGDGVASNNFVEISNGTPNLDESRQHFNNAELASLNGIYNPNKNLKIKGLVFFASDENSFKNSATEQFLLPPNTFTNTESYQLRKKSLAGSGKWDALFNINKKSQIEYVGRYSYGNYKDNAHLLFNEEEINETLKSNSVFTDHRLTYTIKTHETEAFQLTGRYIYDEKPQNYSVDTFLYANLFPSISDIALVEQQSYHRIGFLGLEGSYIINKAKNNLTITSGFTQNKNHLNSDLYFTDTSGNTTEAGNDYKNDFTYTVRDYYLKTKYKYTHKKTALISGIEVHRFNTILSKYRIEEKEAQVSFIPSIGISWQLNKENRLLATYKYNAKNLPFAELYNGFLLTDYRSFKRGLGKFQQLKGSFFLASYILGDWNDSFMINTSMIYNRDHDYVAGNSLIESNFTQYTPIILADRDFVSLNFTGDKFIELLSSNLKMVGSISKNAYQNMVNGSNLRSISANTYTYGGELRSAFSGFFDIHIGTTWTNARVKTSQESRNLDNVSFLDLNFDLSDKLGITLNNERYYFGNLSSDKSFYFSDLKAQYNVKRNKLTLKLILSNIFNTNVFSNFNISDTGSYSATHRLIPRYILMKLDYRF